MKLNWGYGVTILTIGFIGFMAFLVIAAFRQNFDLVAEDYYGKELVFQSQIEKQKNQQALKENIHYMLTEESITVRFPSDHSGKKIEGEIVFFRPSDASKDMKVKIASLEKDVQVIDRKKFVKGLYKIQINYQVEGKEYYFEDALMME